MCTEPKQYLDDTRDFETKIHHFLEHKIRTRTFSSWCSNVVALNTLSSNPNHVLILLR